MQINIFNIKIYIFFRKYTKLKDIYGNKIFIGDILYEQQVGLFSGGVVIEEKGEYLLKNWHCGGQLFDAKIMKKVGNIFNNPELLEPRGSNVQR